MRPGFGRAKVYSRLLPTGRIASNSRLSNSEQPVLLDGLLPEFLDDYTTGSQPIAAHVGLDEAGINIHLWRQQTHTEQLVIKAVEDLPEAFPANPVYEVGDGEWSNTGSSMVRKQNHL